MDHCKKKTEKDDPFISLLWDDILFTKILPYLTMKDIFVLRGLSTRYKLLIDSYFKHMKYLNLPPVFSVVAFKVLAENSSQLKILNVSHCKWLTDDLIIPLFENNPHLQKIKLNRCENLTSVCLQPVIINCKELRSLFLVGCHWLTVGCLESITLHQRNLVEVDFSECRNISNEITIKKFLSLSHSLKLLNLSKLMCVNDAIMTVIAHSAEELEFLNIGGCRNVTTQGVRFVIEYCHKLKTVVCLGCPSVVTNLLKFSHRPKLKVYGDTIYLSRFAIPGLNV